MEEQEAKATVLVTRYIWWSVGAGCIPLPYVDLATVSGIQVKMLYELSKLYGVEFRKNRVKSLVAALVGGLAPGIGSTFKLLPGIGTLVGNLAVPVFAGASTYAVGKVFIQHFEAGGTFLDMDPTAVREYFMAEFDKGRKVAQQAASEIKKEAAEVSAGGFAKAPKKGEPVSV